MNFKTTIFTILSVFSLQVALAEPVSEKTVRELLTLTGASNMGVQVMNNMLQAMKKIIPNAPETFWSEFMKEANVDELTTLVIPIYQKYYSEEDVQATILFYKSPAGQRMLTTMPVMMQESMQAGQTWGQQIAKRAFEKAKSQQLVPAK